MTHHWITSIGIDIGTSTTKIIVSRLRLEKMSTMVSLPRFDIVERKLLYESEVQTTPLLSEEEIDLNLVSEFIRREYKKAQIDPSEIQSGAVIITGETANKKNARHVLYFLADRAGDFVVAAAGANLEGILAGKGSGAEKRSKEIQGIIANIDIGGGTANVALFEKGKVCGTVTYHVGGRLTHQELTEEIIRTEVLRGMEHGTQLFDPKNSPPFAIALKGISICTYTILKVLSRELANGYHRLFPDCSAMVVICEEDMAKALGQSLTLLCEGHPRILCIDQISVEHGDYIDLGEPIAGKVIPVVIKILAFY